MEIDVIFSDALRISLENLGFEAVSVPVPPTGVGRRDLLHAVIKTQPGVVLLDLNLGPAGDGAALIEPLSLAGRRVVVLTASQDHLQWGECLARGAVAVVPKVVPLQVLVDVIRRADQGLPVLPGAERERLIELWRDHHSHGDERRKRLARLTPREAHVLEQLAHGKRVRQVAEDDFVSETTVRTHVKSILAKLGVKSQLAAVAIVHDVGWTPANAELPEPAHKPPELAPHQGTLQLAQESVSPLGGEHHPDRPPEDAQVEHQGPVLDISEIQAHRVVPRRSKRPLTCHRPVMPGLTARRRRTSPSYRFHRNVKRRPRPDD